VRLALTEDAIVGAVVMGEQALSFPLQELMEGRADVAAIVPKLRIPGAPVSEIVERFWRDWKASRA
jgi:NAD(P)H-nitrite reductase large subunit